MKELFDSFLPDWISNYVYLPYMLAVWLAVEWLRYQFDGLDSKIKPKHLTLIVGLVAGVVFHYGEKYLEGVEVPVWMLLVSFLITTWFYEYGIRFVKDKIPFLQNFANKQKQ